MWSFNDSTVAITLYYHTKKIMNTNKNVMMKVNSLHNTEASIGPPCNHHNIGVFDTKAPVVTIEIEPRYLQQSKVTTQW